MNALANEMFHQSRIFDASNTVSDSRRLKLAQRFPDAVGPARFARMRCAIQSVIDRVAERRNVRIDRIAGFVSCDVERGNAAATKPFHQTRSHETLFAIEVTQRAQDEPRINASRGDRSFGGAIHHGHHLLGR